MKNGKRIAAGILTLGMALAVTACGGKEQTVTYRMEQEQSGISQVDTLILEAKGDKVHTMKEEVVVDISSLDAETQEQVSVVYDDLVKQYKEVEGVTCTGEATDGAYTIEIQIDATGDAVGELAEKGLLQVKGDTDGISLKATGEALTAGGYELVE